MIRGITFIADYHFLLFLKPLSTTKTLLRVLQVVLKCVLHILLLTQLTMTHSTYVRSNFHLLKFNFDIPMEVLNYLFLPQYYSTHFCDLFFIYWILLLYRKKRKMELDLDCTMICCLTYNLLSHCWPFYSLIISIWKFTSKLFTIRLSLFVARSVKSKPNQTKAILTLSGLGGRQCGCRLRLKIL